MTHPTVDPPVSIAASQRHGPSEFKKWRRYQSIEDVDRHEYDSTWEQGLAEKFQTVIIDDAHIVKGISSDTTATDPKGKIPTKKKIKAASHSSFQLLTQPLDWNFDTDQTTK